MSAALGGRVTLTDAVCIAAARLRADELPYNQIARELGLRDRKSANDAVRRAVRTGLVDAATLPPPNFGAGRGEPGAPKAGSRVQRLTPRNFDAPPADDRDWRRHGACRRSGINPNRFYPTGADWSTQTDAERAKKAKAICSWCVIEADCLEFALASRDPWAVAGGTTPAERDQVLADRDNEADQNGSAA